MSPKSIPIYPANLATLEESWIFRCPNAPFEQPQRQNTIWCDMKFYAHHFIQHIAHLLCRDDHSWGGEGRGGVCISVVGKQPFLRDSKHFLNFVSIMKNYFYVLYFFSLKLFLNQNFFFFKYQNFFWKCLKINFFFTNVFFREICIHYWRNWIYFSKYYCGETILKQNYIYHHDL